MTPSRARALHRLLLRAALSGAQVFAWIFVFQFFYVRSGDMAQAIASLALTYALTQVITILVTPWAARRVRYGFRRLLVYAVIFLAGAFAALAASFAGYLGPLGWGIGLFAMCMGIYRGLYWVPYEVALIPGQAGGQESGSSSRWGSSTEIFIALMPAIVGLALTMGPISPIVLLCGATVLVLLALVPLSFMRDVREGFLWGYRQTFHEFFAYTRRRMTLEAVMNGIEGAALLFLWPLVIFVLLSWSYPMLGIVLSVTYLVGLTLRGLFRAPLSRASSPILALLAASAWVMRLTVGGAVGVILVDTYFYVGSRPKSRGIDMHTFEQAADNATFVDEHTALKEMGLGFGRLFVALLTALLVLNLSVPLTFIVVFLCTAAAAALAIYLGRA